MEARTIIAAAFESNRLKELVLDQSEAQALPEADISDRIFKIRAADSHGRRSSANILVSRMYAWRGYDTSTMAAALEAAPPNRITLVAVDKDATIGTLSIGFDGPAGLLVEELFPQEVGALRKQGKAICEFIKLAIDGAVKSKRVLASLFHVAYIYAHRMNGCHALMIEVNPRHVRYYERMLGFAVVGSERLNHRVNAPAVLLCLDFAHAQEQINRYGGRPELGATQRTLYPYFFSVGEEAGIVGRLHAEP